LLILDGVPRPMDAAERRQAIALTDSPARLAREVQWIGQGMGRDARLSSSGLAGVTTLMSGISGIGVPRPVAVPAWMDHTGSEATP
jgi:hypothetical protein